LFARIKRNLHNRWCRLKLIRVDGAYVSIVEKVHKQFGWTLEIVRRPEGIKGFQILPRRWVVERTFGWLGHDIDDWHAIMNIPFYPVKP
jgi:putative transposase